MLSEISIVREPHPSTPSHHVTTKPKIVGWSSFLPSWSSASEEDQVSSTRSAEELAKNDSAGPKPASFRNPWPSWHKANRQEVWNALEWGDDQDPCIALATQHERIVNDKSKEEKPSTSSALAAALLGVQKPDFSFDADLQRYKVTWLGHAGILLQLPPIQVGGRPFRCVFDPFFSLRCSPNQFAGPLRTYPAPCKIEDLPEIDVVMISHNHYDHLDYDTIMSLWSCNKNTIRFLVPFGNAAWFRASGIPDDRVVDMDWWDAVHFHISASESIEITCTPSQHNSGRAGYAPNSTLWSSWYVKYPLVSPLRVFFGGDTGFQYHDSLSWPPAPSSYQPETVDKLATREDVNGPWPTCPAFEQIAKRLGSPNLVMLPVAVGATYDYLRSFVPLPNSISPFPRHRPGITAANHMPPWDAVRVFRLMTADSEQEEAAVAVAIHWGTFVTDPVEVLKTLGQLENACQQQDVQFARSVEETLKNQPCFIALDHGQSVSR